ncbi:MAG: hypothetical protein Kow00121_31630 [Elainellaceae cyanobacterium]
MNIEHLRKSLKVQWLNYYRNNRDWLARLGVWVTCDGKRRPSSSFILATLSILEPQLTQLLPLVVDLSSNPDRIVMALGLNFNPDDELKAFEEEQKAANGQVKMLPGGLPVVEVAAKRAPRATEVRTEAVRSSSKPASTVSIASAAPFPAQPKEASEPIAAAQSMPVNLSPVQGSASPTAPSSETIFETPDEIFETPTQPVASSSPKPVTRTEPSRPVMDTAELAAGELPERDVKNDVKNVDDSCEGVRGNSEVRTRWD